MELERIRGIAQGVAEGEGLEVVAVEWAGSDRHGVLRITIDRPEGGISHDDCQRVSEQVGTILDVEDLVPGRYTLEVASPGLDRKLYGPSDYERFRGRRVKVRLRQPRAELGGKRFTGILEGASEGVVQFQVEERIVRIPYEEIAQANLVIEL